MCILYRYYMKVINATEFYEFELQRWSFYCRFTVQIRTTSSRIRKNLNRRYVVQFFFIWKNINIYTEGGRALPWLYSVGKICTIYYTWGYYYWGGGRLLAIRLKLIYCETLIICRTMRFHSALFIRYIL